MAKRKIPPTRFPDAVAVSYSRSIKKMVSELGKETLALYDKIAIEEFSSGKQDSQSYIEDGLFESFRNMLARLSAKTAKIFSANKKEKVATTFVKNLNRFNQHNVEQQAKVKGINPIATEPWIKPFMEKKITENVSYITNIQDDYVQQIEDIVYEGVTKGASNKQIREQLVERIGVAENRAQFLAVDQTGTVLGQLTAERHHQIGIDKFKWLTSADERVRDSHNDLSDKVFAYDDPPEIGGRKLIPGEDYRCRCVAIPVFDDEED